ncbi:MAG: FAD-dependent thymidylate synthase [Candidatus Saccharibacteria bacterium]|nr:FAD-dependent thymidylate synthase [Candidatus Saccharibacteria bacterium]
MKIDVLASTKLGHWEGTRDMLRLSGLEAGICYMPKDYKNLIREQIDKTMQRANGTVENGHHSVTGHPSYNLVLIDIPKILAMLLNNEKEYTTSEKSGRYTVMTAANEEERQLYEKWREKFAKMIAEEYPEIPARTVNKLAMENARLFISVFTPATTMGYTVSLRQANYLIGFCEKMISESNLTPFYQKLIPYLVEFSDNLRKIVNVEGLRENFGRGFSLFGSEEREEYFGDVYSTNYLESFVGLASALRHRSLWYEMRLPEEKMFYAAPIIAEDSETFAEYMDDMHSVADNFPQGMLVEVNERGTTEAFIMKCHERLCGATQPEICQQTRTTLDRYILSTSKRMATKRIAEELRKLKGKIKCQMGFSCRQPCALGPEQVFSRKI